MFIHTTQKQTKKQKQNQKDFNVIKQINTTKI